MQLDSGHTETQDMSLAPGDLLAIYKLVHGCMPISNDQLQPLQNLNTVADLREYVLSSSFCVSRIEKLQLVKPFDYEPSHIEFKASDEVIEKMLDRNRHTFDTLAETEPHWAVVTQDQYKSDSITENLGKFYDTGRNGLMVLDHLSKRADIDLSQFRDCFELGCGVGRATHWLSQTFPYVIAGDVAPNMLRTAKQHFDKDGIKNVDLILTNSVEQFKFLPNFDVFFSEIALQHNPPPVIYFMLKMVLQKLRPNGIAMFQLLTARRNYNFDHESYLATPLGSAPGVEMHVLPQPALFSLLRELRCDILEIREDGACGPTPDMISNVIFVRKASD